MSSECFNCDSGVTIDEDFEERPRVLIACAQSGCDKTICDTRVEECEHTRSCDICEHLFCWHHARSCELCDGKFCFDCRLFNRDSARQMCNECFKRETWNLEPSVEFTDSSDEEMVITSNGRRKPKPRTKD